MSSANSEFYFFFPIWIPFISFSALIAVAKTSKTMLDSSDESGHPCLVPDYRRNARNLNSIAYQCWLKVTYKVDTCKVRSWKMDMNERKSTPAKKTGPRIEGQWTIKFISATPNMY